MPSTPFIGTRMSWLSMAISPRGAVMGNARAGSTSTCVLPSTPVRTSCPKGLLWSWKSPVMLELDCLEGCQGQIVRVERVVGIGGIGRPAVEKLGLGAVEAEIRAFEREEFLVLAFLDHLAAL